MTAHCRPKQTPKNGILFSRAYFTAFILPVLSNYLLIRLTILLLYFILHCFNIQHLYAKYKYKS